MSKFRFEVVQDAFKKRAVAVTAPSDRVSDYFGERVFNMDKMRKYLDAHTFKLLTACIENGVPLEREIADAVADGMKTWAMEQGATHITHWFQPLTEGTAEKHDSFMEYDGKGGMIETFDGKALVQQEPDASSFPSGGIRATFEARGYTAWDPTSPVFIQGDTLCIPTVFISYTGEALDYKTPLKKALKAVNDAALPLCRLFDPKVQKVFSYLGWEQEYFLVDEDLYAARPDLMLTGRTLMGHAASKNQQLDDHYFGAIPSRVVAFMRDIEVEGYKMGIPLKTRHNEVAPNQFELAPVYGECNLSNDQNQLMMNIMKTVARKHGFVVLFHEKPFEGINGSGKHNNWSLGTDTGTPLLAPGKDAMGNLQFVMFFVNVLSAVQKNNALLKASTIEAFMDQPDYIKRRQVADTRETVDRILAKNASLTRENDSLHVTNRQLKAEITALSEKVESLNRTQTLLSRKVLFLMKTTDEASRKAVLTKMGIADQEIDLDAYTQSLSLEIRNVMDINRAVTRHMATYGSIPDKDKDGQSTMSLSDSVIAGLHFGEDSNEYPAH